MTPLLDSYAGVPGYAILYALLAIALGLFGYRIFTLYSYLRLGQKENRFDNISRRLLQPLRALLLQACSLRSVSSKDLAGLGHAMLAWGFLIFALSYLFIFVGAAWTEDFSQDIFGNLGSQVFSLFLEIFALLVIIAVVWAAYRRYVLKPERLELSLDAVIILVMVFSLMVTLLAVDGLWVAGTGEGSATWLPIGTGLSKLVNGLDEKLIENLHTGFWWGHMVIMLSFLVYVPYSKHLHIVASPINLFFRSTRPRGALTPIDVEKTETLGAGKIEEFTWKQLLDCYACAHCGRCQVSCPAFLSGKPLSPKKLILDLQEHLLEEGKLLRRDKSSGQLEARTPDRHMIGDVVTEDEIWACTTCGACVEECPVGNEHIDKIIDMRRNLVLAQSKMPEPVQLMLRNMQARGHPWAGVQSLRLRGDWTGGLDLKILDGDANIDILFWVGCTGAMVDRNVEATLALVRVLQAADVNFGVLGEMEPCCGDPARRAGYEFQFQVMAEQNIELLKSYNIKEIVTSCPHCYNTFKNEYPQYGGDFKVVHYTQLIADLIKQGRLKLTNELSSVLTYHDPCYLGRYHGEYSAPREVLRAIPQTKLHEMERSFSKSFCCGGGGGHMWMEEQIGRKINEIRIEDALKTEAETVVTACPYCLQMLEEAIERKEVKDSLKAMDLVELVERAMEKSE